MTQIVGAGVGSPPRAVRPVSNLALDSVGHAACAEWTREHIGHAGHNGVGGQFRVVGVDDGEHRRTGAVRTKLTSGLESGGASREFEQHRHVAALQLAERRRGAVGPDDGEVGGRQDFLGFRSIGGGAAEIENGFQKCTKR